MFRLSLSLHKGPAILSASASSSVTSRTLYRACLLHVGHLINRAIHSIILGIEANHVVHEGKLKKGSFVRLKGYQANAVKGKRYDPVTFASHEQSG